MTVEVEVVPAVSKRRENNQRQIEEWPRGAVIY